MNKKLRRTSLFIGLVLVILACKDVKEQNTETLKESVPIKEHSILSVLWQQNAAEYRALCHQAFNIARQNINSIQGTTDKPFAIITDIDETVLDNSPYNGMLIKKEAEYSRKDWEEWGKLEDAKALPGAVDFFNYSDSIGIEVFYISNRYDTQLLETINNLKKLNLPNADSEHVFLRSNSSKKQERRNRILDNFNVIMYLGDNLTDFSSLFDDQNTDHRNQLVDSLRNSFGTTFIIFPNPMYGDWETKGLYENNRQWSNRQKDSIRKIKINSYK